MPANNVTIKANWTDTYTVTINLNGGSGSSKSGSYPAGTTVSLNAGTREGFVFNRWTATNIIGPINPEVALGMVSATDANITFIVPNYHVTITATWELELPPPQFNTIVILDGGNGSSASGSYAEGATVYLNAGTKTGFIFTGWTAIASPPNPPTPVTVSPLPPVPAPGVPEGSTHSFLMPAFDVIVAANWIALPPPGYTVTLEGGGTGSFGSGQYLSGDTVYLSTGTAQPGFTFSGWTVIPTVPGTPVPPITVSTVPDLGFPIPGVPPGSTHLFAMPAYNVTVIASWTAIPPPPF